ncbi:MAG TPA: MmcQ/YjbR family DNA-binding protein [Gaiellaceae bacterium]
MKDLDALALALPEVTREEEEGRPSYSVAGKVFCWHRRPRPDAVDGETGERLEDVLVFWVEDLEVKGMLVESDSPYFTTPHWNGYSAVLLRKCDLKAIRKAELRDRVEEAWLKRAPKKLAKEWLGS